MDQNKLFGMGIVALMLFAFSATASDLRGSLKGVSGAKIKVTCGAVTRSSNIAKNGGYRVSDLPANKSCGFTVSHGSARSVKISFSTKNSVTNYNGVLRKVGKKLIVVRQ